MDDIQQAINRMIHLILEVNRGVAQWGQRHLQRSILKTEPASAGFGKKAKKGESEYFVYVLFYFLLYVFALIAMPYINICE